MDNGSANDISFSALRRWGILLTVALGIFALLAILAMCNYLAVRYPMQFVLSPRGESQLRPQTLNLLKHLTNRIDITMFIEKQDNADLHDLTLTLVRAYERASSLITVTAIQPISDFSRAAAVLSRYKFTPESRTNRNFVLVASGDQTQVIAEYELAERDISQVLAQTGQEVGLKDFNGERAITSAIYRLINPRKIKAYFLRGNYEHDPKSDDPTEGFSKFANMLKQDLDIEWDTFAFVGTNEVPADCQLLVLAGTRTVMELAALDGIQTYLKSGGRALVLLSSLIRPGTRIGPTGIELVLKKWNVDVVNAVVCDPNFSPPGTEARDLGVYLQLYVNYTPESQQHPVTKPIVYTDPNHHIRLMAPRVVHVPREKPTTPEAPQAVSLACTSTEGSFAVMNVDSQGVPMRNKFSDRKDAAFSLIVAAEQSGIEGVRRMRNTRLLVVGDSYCFANALIDKAANPDFARLAVNWLVDRPQEIVASLTPMPLNQYHIEVTNQQWRMLNWLLLAGLPGGVLLIGALVWLRRRS